MSENYLISIIINNYNYAQFLAAAIDSALQQEYAETEVIVVDDGSSDGSAAIIQSYGDSILSILKPNGGQASAFNVGFSHARGEIVIFLDADDQLLPQITRQVNREFQKKPTLANLQYRMAVIDANGKHSGQLKPAEHLPLPGGDLRQQMLRFPLDLPWMATSGNAFSAAVLRQILPIPEAPYGRVGADWYVVHLSRLFGPVAFLEGIGALYRVHANNNYESSEPVLNFAQMRQTVTYSQLTMGYLAHYAQKLGLAAQENSDDILSVSYIANRLALYKLAAAQSPIRGESLLKLLCLGIVAAWRRSDMSWLVRMMFCVWFLVVAIAPPSLARWLCELFFFPERRAQFNRFLKRVQT